MSNNSNNSTPSTEAQLLRLLTSASSSSPSSVHQAESASQHISTRSSPTRADRQHGNRRSRRHPNSDPTNPREQAYEGESHGTAESDASGRETRTGTYPTDPSYYPPSTFDFAQNAVADELEPTIEENSNGVSPSAALYQNGNYTSQPASNGYHGTPHNVQTLNGINGVIQQTMAGQNHLIQMTQDAGFEESPIGRYSMDFACHELIPLGIPSPRIGEYHQGRYVYNQNATGARH
ncbi:uncharacterized protein BP5553_10697 [Venustampulla echinocandica]|uniref:Uncharacterized protein n=1 Tax=Venustampulla echinocandica TaxID=2656787 RepID=A0A370T8N0_9HELO|nr:uncharacterized protein BP5553_10697 [Venustampulla echinocandica]RDL29717.1 hypothetical protein BP5553_10697 [Venustampulla echinocandica]